MAESLTLTTNTISLQLTKDETAAEQKSLEVDLKTSGTDWAAATSQSWHLDAAALPLWVGVDPSRTNGTVTSQLIRLPISISSTLLSDAAAPHSTDLHVYVRDSSTGNETQLTVPISVLVTALPVASQSTIDEQASTRTLHRPKQLDNANSY